MLETMRTHTAKSTTVSRVTCAIRDDLLASQHQAADVDDEVHMDADYVLDASLDESLDEETRQLCKELVEEFPRSEAFIFTP